MSESSWCKTCGAFLFKHHKCPPEWTVFDMDQDPEKQSGIVVRAVSAEDAAERAHEEYDNNEAVLEESRTLVVRAADGTETKWKTCGEATVNYTAEEVE